MTPGMCIHYRGTQKPCAAGIDIRALVGGPNLGWGCRIPCIKAQFNSARPAEKVPCDKYQEPTPEQIAAFDTDIKKYSHNCTKARAAITQHSAGKRGVQGTLPCPICATGDLQYGISGYNGHCRARCTTPNCINFIE